MNFEVTYILTYIILTEVTKRLSSYRNLKLYLHYRSYNILCEGLFLVRQRYQAFLVENMFIIEQALSKDYLTNYWCFLFSFPLFFFFAFNSTCMISSGNIERTVLVNDLFIIRRETCFFLFGEQIITQSQKS